MDRSLGNGDAVKNCEGTAFHFGIETALIQQRDDFGVIAPCSCSGESKGMA